MTDKEFEKARQNYMFLMDCIDEYKNNEASSNEGRLYFLKSVVARLVVSKYERGNMTDFKMFFCNHVLNLYYGYRELSYYEKLFKEGKAEKKYAVTPEAMNEYMDETEIVEHGYPKGLLTRLWEVAHDCLQDYFLKDADKEESYCRFVMAVGLYEIFVDKFLGDATFKKSLSAGKKAEKCLEEVETLLQRMDEMKQQEEELEALSLKAQQLSEKVATAMKEYMAASERAMVYCYHTKYLAAFSAVITLIEFENVNEGTEIADYIKRTDMSKAIKDKLVEEQDYIYMQDVTMNHNVTKLYAAFVENAEQNRILQELCSRSEEIRNTALNQIKQYVQMMKRGNYADKNGVINEDFAEVVNKIAWKCVENAEN